MTGRIETVAARAVAVMACVKKVSPAKAKPIGILLHIVKLGVSTHQIPGAEVFKRLRRRKDRDLKLLLQHAQGRYMVVVRMCYKNRAYLTLVDLTLAERA